MITVNGATTGPRAMRAGLVGGAIACLATPACGTSGEGAPARYRPDAGIPRLDVPAFAVADIQVLTDFDIEGDTLYLLDGAAAGVIVLGRDSSGWSESHRFGGHGGGPGEFERPTGIAIAHGHAFVADGPRLHRLTSAGQLISSRVVDTECGLQRPRVLVTSAVYLVGNCYRRGAGTDTMVAQVYRLQEDSLFRQVGSEILYTRDGSVGSFMTATPTATHGDGRILVGAGSSQCYLEVGNPVGGAAVRKCMASTRQYSAEPPAELAARLRQEGRRRPGMAGSFRWPDALPWFSGLATASGADVVIRMWSADSLVFETADGAHSFLIASLNSFSGCRRDSCLWANATAAGLDLRLVTAAELIRLIDVARRTP